MPSASIVIPTFDRPNSLRAAVSSVLAAIARSGRICEIIVIDDGLRFDAQSALRGLGGAETLRIIKTEGARGPSAARNLGAMSVRAETMFFLDDDDQMVEDYLARILEALETGRCAARWGFTRVTKSRRYRHLPATAGILGGDVALKDRLAALSAGVWIKTALFHACGGLDEGLRINEDTDFCLNLAAHGLYPWYEPDIGVIVNGARLAEAAAAPQTRDSGSITRAARAEARAQAWQVILQRYPALWVQEPALEGEIYARIAKYRARAGDVSGAFTFALQAKRGARLGAVLQALGGALKRGH